MKKILAIILFTFVTITFITGQNIRVSVPSQVATGENFRLSYIVNTADVADFRSGDMPSGLEMLAGPYTSTQSSYQIVNGHSTSSSSITFTYTLYAAKAGTYTIPAAKAVIGGKTINSATATITVSGSASQQRGAPKMHNDDNSAQQSGTIVSGNELFIVASANKKTVYEQEPILLTYKVYTTVDLIQLEGKMPDLKGFHTQEISLPQQKSFSIENYNGKNYRTVTWSQYVMYPQMTGKLEIPSITFHGIVAQKLRNIDPFEEFFNGGSSYQEIKKDINAPAVTIDVQPLPERPSDFLGGVGAFSFEAEVDHNSVKAGDPVKLTLTVSGSGNLKLLKEPVIELPKDIDKYSPKVIDNTSLTSKGLEGSIVYEYLLVPRNQGNYTIPAIPFTYFDLSSKEYKTISSSSIDIEVTPGDGKTTVDDFSDKANDIRDINHGNIGSSSSSENMLFSVTWFICLALPLIVFVVLYVFIRRHEARMSDVVAMKGRKANSVAVKRLKKAVRLMAENKQDEFYDEVLRSLWGYVGDKLNIPVVELSRDNIVDKLSSHNIEFDTIDTFIAAIDECEYARYAPGDPHGHMESAYDKAVTAITNIENMLKNKKSQKSVSALSVLFIMLFAFTNNAFSTVSKQSADQAYNEARYQVAVREYEALLEQNESSVLYYNLGNAYFRVGELTKSIIAYEKANKLSPGDEDILFNLQFARSKTVDKIIPEAEIFIVTWYKSVLQLFSSNTWAVMSVVFFIVGLILFGFYLYGTQMWMLRGGFYGGILSILVFLLSVLFSWHHDYMLSNSNGAVIVQQEVNILKTPSTGSETEMVLHEGTHVEITDREMNDWYCIRIADGRTGWILRSVVEEI